MAGNAPNPQERDITRVVQAVRELFMGRSNAVGSLTLQANATTTTVIALNIGAQSRIFLTARTAAAAQEVLAGELHVSAVASGTFTVAHVNSASADRTFDYVALG